MPRPDLRELPLPQRMAARVRMVAALELRDEGLPGADEAGHESQSALKQKLLGATKDFISKPNIFQTVSQMIEHSRRQLEDVDTIDDLTVRRRFKRIADALDHFSCQHCEDDPDAERRCIAEIEDLFERLNRYVLIQYREIDRDFPAPAVWLQMGHHHENDVSEYLDATAISGSTEFRDEAGQPVSIVTIGVRDHGLDWWSVCHLPYTLLHELLAHAYQGLVTSGRPSVDASCAWTEGWMDALAAVEIDRWLASPLATKPDWIEKNTRSIESGTAILHERRFRAPTALRPYLLDHRISARAGFRALVHAYRGADSRADAALARAVRFTLRFNLQSMEQADRKALVTKLVSGLEAYSDLRLSELLGACSDYAASGDFATFRDRLISFDT